MKQVIQLLKKRRETILYSLRWHERYHKERYQEARAYVMEEVAEIDQALKLLEVTP